MAWQDARAEGKRCKVCQHKSEFISYLKNELEHHKILLQEEKDLREILLKRAGIIREAKEASEQPLVAIPRTRRTHDILREAELNSRKEAINASEK